MKLRCSLLSISLAISVSGWADAASLREQLDLARHDTDRLAQIEIIQRILHAEPTDRELREQLAELWLAIEDYDRAEKTVQDESLVAPSFRVRVLARVIYSRDDKKAEAIALLSDFQAKNPADLAVTRQLAEYLAATGQFQPLVALLDQAPGVGNDVSLLISRAEARRSLQDFGRAIEDFNKASSLASEEPAVVQRRSAFERLQVAQQNIQAASDTLAKDPKSLSALVARAYWYLYTGFASAQAAVDAEAARQAEPEFVSTRLISAYAENASGKLSTENAIKDLHVDVSVPLPEWKALEQTFRADSALKTKPRDVKVLASRAALLAGLQQYYLSEEDWDAVFALAPKDPTPRIEKILLIVKRKDYDAAAVEFRNLESVKVPPAKLASASASLADAAFAESRFEIALDFINRAIKAQPTAQYYRQRAAILQRLNRGAEAEADLAQAKTLTKKTSR